MPYTLFHHKQSFLQPTVSILTLMISVAPAKITIDHALPYGFIAMISVLIITLSVRTITPE